MNKVVLIGRLTSDVELRYTTSNVAVGRVDIAIYNGKDKEGNYRPSDFIHLEAWKTLAENMSKLAGKGDKIAVYGKIKTSSYPGTDGKKKSKTYVLVNEIELLERKENNQNPNNTTSAVSPETTQSSAENNIEESDLYQEFANEVVLDESQLPF